MKLTRYYPSHSLFDSNLFNSLMPSSDEFFNYGNTGLNMYETENTLVVEMEVPGIKEEDIDVNVSDGILTVMAHNATSEERKNEKGIKVYSSSVRNNFSYSTSLPSNIDTSKVDANLDNGILTIEIDKAPESKPKKIKVSKKTK